MFFGALHCTAAGFPLDNGGVADAREGRGNAGGKRRAKSAEGCSPLAYPEDPAWRRGLEVPGGSSATDSGGSRRKRSRGANGGDAAASEDGGGGGSCSSHQVGRLVRGSALGRSKSFAMGQGRHHVGHQMRHGMGHGMRQYMGYDLGHEIGHGMGHGTGQDMGDAIEQNMEHDMGHNGHILGHHGGHQMAPRRGEKKDTSCPSLPKLKVSSG